MLEEGRRWIELGRQSDYFSHDEPRVQFTHPSDRLDRFFPPSTSVEESLPPLSFAMRLAAAQDDLTPDRQAFLELLLFSSDAAWHAHLAEVERFVGSFDAATADESLDIEPISWFLLGSESSVGSAESGPACWRSADDAVLAELQPDRLHAVRQLQAQLLDAILLSLERGPAGLADDDIGQLRALLSMVRNREEELATKLQSSRHGRLLRRQRFVVALDQGTTSSRAMVFNHQGRVESVAQKEHEQIYRKPGWVEHDPIEVWARCTEVLDEALDAAGASIDDVAGLGITNQRETTVVWDRNTGEPIHNALVWQDTRTDKLVDELSADGGQARFQEKVGLPLATYFWAPRCAGSSTTSTAPVRRPMPVTSSSATWTPG